MNQDPSQLATLLGGGAVTVVGVTMLIANLLHAPGDRASRSWTLWGILAVLFGGVLTLASGIAIVF